MLTLQSLFTLLIEKGRTHDPRSKAEIDRLLNDIKKEYDKLEKDKKSEFDLERLKNPYGDSRIIFGAPETKIKRMYAGIDVETPELLLIDRLRERGEQIDFVLAHHPEGLALVGLAEVMPLQNDIAELAGVPVNIAEKILDKRVGEVGRSLHAINFFRERDAAQLLNLPFAAVHTPADNCVYDYLTKLFQKEKPRTLGEILEILKTVEEFQIAARQGMGPKIFVGSEKSRAGKIVASGMTGGTTGSEDMYLEMAKAGVGTLIKMHIPETHRKKAEEAKINIIIAGHMASDSLGMNLLLDEVEKKGVEVVPFAGLMRVKRSR